MKLPWSAYFLAFAGALVALVALGQSRRTSQRLTPAELTPAANRSFWSATGSSGRLTGRLKLDRAHVVTSGVILFDEREVEPVQATREAPIKRVKERK